MSTTLYRVKNWPTYNKLLQDRWNINIWLTPQAVERWFKAGKKSHYTNQTILLCLTIRALYNLSLRATQGLINSLISCLNLSIKCPDYSRLSRRGKGLSKVKIPRIRGSKAVYICVDSTGMKMYGPGEWQSFRNQSSKKRTWRKIHIAMDPVTQQITTALLTPSRYHDSKAVLPLLKPLKDPLRKFYADGAYDSGEIYTYLHARHILPLIPVANNATQTYSRETKPHFGKKRLIERYPELHWRNVAVKHKEQFSDPHEGIRDWKKSSGYHLRSLVENTMMRLKRTFTDKLRARTLDNQKTELYIKCLILNKFIEMGLPYTVPSHIPHLPKTFFKIDALKI